MKMVELFHQVNTKKWVAACLFDFTSKIRVGTELKYSNDGEYVKIADDQKVYAFTVSFFFYF